MLYRVTSGMEKAMDADNLARLHVEIDRLQNAQSGPYILHKPAAIGLGGQITARMDMLLLALALNRRAVFPLVEDFPYKQVFMPMSTGKHVDVDLAAVPLVTPDAIQSDEFVLYDAMRSGVHHFHEHMRKQIESRLNIPLPSLQALIGALLTWMQPTAEMRSLLDHSLTRLGVNQDTLGVHFRRGDKSVETPFVPAHEFNKIIFQIYEIWPFKSLFLASDCPDAPSMIEVPRGVSLIFDGDEKRFNNANHKMLIAKPELALQETEVAFKNYALLSSCGGIVGQDNAHFATLAAAIIENRLGRRDTIYLIDGRIRENQSWFLRQRFRLSRSARRTLVNLLPCLSTASRAARRKRKNFK